MLFEPFRIKNVSFVNRVLRSSMGGRNACYDGPVSPAWVHFERRFAAGGELTSGPQRLGLRAENHASGACLTMAASARVLRTSVPNHSHSWVDSPSLSKLGRRGSDRLRRGFLIEGSRWPHR